MRENWKGLGAVQELRRSSTDRGLVTRRIALMGNPNSGKTTVFNHLTGLRHKVGNYPGVTVEWREGILKGCPSIKALDLPGCYSLTPRSLDERLARDALLGWAQGVDKPDGVIVIVDACNLKRNLYLATQILELNIPTVIACNMMDLVEARGDLIDLKSLQEQLGVPVIGMAASSGRGVDDLRRAVLALDEQAPRRGHWLDDGSVQSSIDSIDQLVREVDIVDESKARGLATLLLSPAALQADDPAYVALPRSVRTQIASIQEASAGNGRESASSRAIQARYRRLDELVESVLCRGCLETGDLIDRVDQFVTHPIWGLGLFSAIMAVMFLAIFSWAGPLMDGIEWFVGAMQSGVAAVLGAGMLADLLSDGVVGGVGNVIVFFPQICILFFFIAVLEDSGYMARAAFVMDRVMGSVGLHGKSFIPLLSCFACAVPGIMATRTIENRRDRLATILVAPLMSCSARLPIYILIISLLFGSNAWLAAGIMFSMYALGLVTALVMAFIFKRTILRGPTPAFILELPPYRLPRLRMALRHTWERSKQFLTQAGTIILTCSIILWALAYFPAPPDNVAGEPGARLRHSVMGHVGHVIEPVIEPLGFDWKIGIGIISSFAAREVFVATMGVVYGVEEEADETSPGLRQRMKASTWPDGSKVYTPLVGISILVFYVLACQCMSTLAVVRRETGTWRWPLFLFSYMTILAYAGSLIVYQGGKLLGFA